MSEECCHRIGELLASLSNIPESNVTAKFAVFEEIAKLLVHEIDCKIAEAEDKHLDNYEHHEKPALVEEVETE